VDEDNVSLGLETREHGRARHLDIHY
jgi:hypothetical protein